MTPPHTHTHIDTTAQINKCVASRPQADTSTFCNGPFCTYDLKQESVTNQSCICTFCLKTYFNSYSAISQRRQTVTVSKSSAAHDAHLRSSKFTLFLKIVFLLYFLTKLKWSLVRRCKLNYRMDVAHGNAIPKRNVKTTLIFRIFFISLKFLTSVCNCFASFLIFFQSNSRQQLL